MNKSFLTKDNLFITYHSKANKMRGLYSINSTCIKPCKISGLCYANRYLSYRPAVKNRYEQNAKVLDNAIFDFPVFPDYSIVRFFSFGDISGYNAAANMYHIAKHNPNCVFGIWIRNETFDFMRGNITDNMVLNFSNKEINKPVTPENIIDIPAQNSFNLVEKDKLEEIYHNLVNRGIKTHVCMKECKTCLICYKKSNEKKTILEVIK